MPFWLRFSGISDELGRVVVRILATRSRANQNGAYITLKRVLKEYRFTVPKFSQVTIIIVIVTSGQ